MFPNLTELRHLTLRMADETSGDVIVCRHVTQQEEREVEKVEKLIMKWRESKYINCPSRESTLWQYYWGEGDIDKVYPFLIFEKEDEGWGRRLIQRGVKYPSTYYYSAL